MAVDYQARHTDESGLTQVPCIKQLSTEALFGRANELFIVHAGECYQLTITKQNKLLLTKVKRNFN